MPPADDYDSPWKTALHRYFPEFMAFYFPEASLAIDWRQPCVFLDQELAQVTRDAALGRRRVDKLVRVVPHAAPAAWIYVHVDVQGYHDRLLAERIFTYHYRLYDRYRHPIASLVLLADGRPAWRPSRFAYQALGCDLQLSFPVVKLIDFAPQRDRLLRQNNAFALVTAAHLLTQQTRGNAVQRHAAKWRLARLLYERAWDRQRIVDLFAIIDWMMRLPDDLEAQLMHDIGQMEKEKNMPYMNSFERLGMKQGLQQGLQQGLDQARADMRKLLSTQLEQRFGSVPTSLQTRVAQADYDELLALGKALLEAPSAESLLSTPAGPPAQA